MLREKSRLEAELDRLDTLKNCHASMLDWQEMAQELSGGAEIKEGGDAAEALESLGAEIERLTELLEETETNLLLSSEEDHADAILEIHPGAGGTEAQDWAQMLQAHVPALGGLARFFRRGAGLPARRRSRDQEREPAYFRRERIWLPQRGARHPPPHPYFSL